MVLRQRKGRGGLEKVVQDFDAFPKVPETYVEQTNSGAASEYELRNVIYTVRIYVVYRQF